ncbi:hypothetical protein B4U80_03165 [Leptotrombidium deliense]|uniref:Uncharacterized protein n=1 Tax=Leptotrombidium deliense TaxID=299467 RepID=A0A443SGG4_9ACAR|nr:hypothetical protein B4U80_03165 [Leptotrombidium deliense]
MIVMMEKMKITVDITHYRCSDTGLCMDNYNVCDGRVDCRNGEDEDPRFCGYNNIGRRRYPVLDLIRRLITGRIYKK